MTVQIKGMETNKTGETVDENTDVVFNVTSSLTESERGQGFINLKFSMNMDTEPSAARIYVSGTASVAGSENEIAELLESKEKDGTPTVFVKVYQRVYPTIYLMCGSLHVPYPGPGLLRQTSVHEQPQVVPMAQRRPSAQE